MSIEEKAVSSVAAARAFGQDPKDIVAVVEAARAKHEESKALKAKVGVDVDKAMGKSREETVEKVETVVGAVQALEQADAAPAAESAPAAPEQPAREDEFRRREKALVEKQQRFTREREQFEAYRRKTESELTEARNTMALIQRDPFAFLEQKFGYKREMFLGPQGGQQQRPAGQPGAAPQPAHLPPEVAAELEEVRRWRQEEAQRRAHEHRERELNSFADQAKGGGEKWPLASKYSADKLKARGWQIASTHAQTGVILTNEEVLDRIEEELSEIASLRAPKPTPAAASKPIASTGPEDKRTAQPTLTSGGVSESSGVPRSPLKMTKRERIEAAVLAVNEANRARQTTS